ARGARRRPQARHLFGACRQRLAECRSNGEGGSRSARAGPRGRARGGRVTDEIILTLPRERRYYDVAHLVVGGLAARLDLTVDNLADLQLALAGLLPRRESEGEVTVVLRIDGDLLDGRIGPFDPRVIAELERE